MVREERATSQAELLAVWLWSMFRAFCIGM